ncbi:MAG: homoserine kinase [Proteobacteria bacterium]|nr:homoserine kinase [Pseudomonadota bacterium]
MREHDQDMALKSPHSSIRVSVPGTSANVGPGFDSFGIALGLANQVTVSLKRPVTPHPAIVLEAADSFFLGSGLTPFDFSWKITGKVPQARGLGSSVTVRLGVLIGLNALAGKPLSRNGLFRLCSELEGHPDNAAPAVYGGFTIARSHLDPVRFAVASTLRFVLLIPDFEVATPAARKVMPKSIGITESASNAADAAVIAAAFATRNYKLLRGAFGDRLHQPFRAPLVPFLHQVIRAGEEAGAIGGWLSGSGSTICCLSPDAKSSIKIASAMRSQASKGSTVMICSPDNKGAFVTKS